MMTISTNKRPIRQPRYYLIDQEVARLRLALSPNLIISPRELFQFLRDQYGLITNTYRQFSQDNNISPLLVPTYVGSMEAALYYKKDTERAYLYYNERTYSLRKKFGIFHEIGHFIMQHPQLHDFWSTSDKKIFEEEANYFAKELSAPRALIDYFVCQLELPINYLNIYSLYRFFDLSKKSAGYSAEAYLLYKHVKICPEYNSHYDTELANALTDMREYKWQALQARSKIELKGGDARPRLPSQIGDIISREHHTVWLQAQKSDVNDA